MYVYNINIYLFVCVQIFIQIHVIYEHTYVYIYICTSIAIFTFKTIKNYVLTIISPYRCLQFQSKPYNRVYSSLPSFHVCSICNVQDFQLQLAGGIGRSIPIHLGSRTRTYVCYMFNCLVVILRKKKHVELTSIMYFI